MQFNWKHDALFVACLAAFYMVCFVLLYFVTQGVFLMVGAEL